MTEAGATEIVSTDVKPTRTGSDSRFEDAPPEHGRGATALHRTELDVAPLRTVHRPERLPPRDPRPWSGLRSDVDTSPTGALGIGLAHAQCSEFWRLGPLDKKYLQKSAGCP
jgi:hypothetical protein